MMSNKPLTDKQKQFTVLPNEADPKSAFTKARQAVSKALAEVKKTKADRP
ncbi:hypothetical protein ACL7TT_16155 [Microbulbifer sp. 2304DJ12-6]